MASCIIFPDVLTWIQNLPPISQWPNNKSSSISTSLCSSTYSQPSLDLSISKTNYQTYSNTICLAIEANFSLPISLWTSKPLKINYYDSKPLDDRQTLVSLFVNLIEDVLHYGSNDNNSSTKFLKIDPADDFNTVKETFNTAFLTLFFLICIYEAPLDLRRDCLNSIKNSLAQCQSRRATKLLMKLLGSNLEEQWMRSINLAVTNWIAEARANRRPCGLNTPSPLFSYSVSTLGMWKVQLYCPLIAMNFESSSSNPNCNNNSNNNSGDDQKLKFSLDYHQLEGVIQFNYRVVPQERWVGVMVNIDNIRCDVMNLVNETLMSKRGVGLSEKHFPSRIALQLTPTLQTNVLSVSVSKSSENPLREIGFEKTLEAGFEPPNPYMGLKVSAAETVTVSLRPWKFEQSVHGYSASLNWYLHDSADGREVFSSKPSRLAMMNPKAWFKQRYSSAQRPFTRQGGVVFAGDEYGELVVWKVDKAAMGRPMEWEVRGWVWLTYWPNKYRTFYTETRRLEFREVFGLMIS